jgi:gamma-glutamylcysteine synthetase
MVAVAVAVVVLRLAGLVLGQPVKVIMAAVAIALQMLRQAAAAAVARQVEASLEPLQVVAARVSRRPSRAAPLHTAVAAAAERALLLAALRQGLAGLEAAARVAR